MTSYPGSGHYEARAQLLRDIPPRQLAAELAAIPGGRMGKSLAQVRDEWGGEETTVTAPDGSLHDVSVAEFAEEPPDELVVVKFAFVADDEGAHNAWVRQVITAEEAEPRRGVDP